MSRWEKCPDMPPPAEREEYNQSTGKKVLAYWKLFVLFITPLAFLPLPIILQEPMWRCMYMMIIMAVYWVTEAVPLAVTSLIPVIAGPLLGLMPSSKVCPLYAKDTILLFLAGLMIAVAVEHWNLHKRIAIKILLLVGSAPQWVMLGFMLATWFLSMWISNTSTTAMMIPIATAVVNEMRRGEEAAAGISPDDDDPDVADINDIALENKGYVSDEKNPVDNELGNGTDGMSKTDSTGDIISKSPRPSIVPPPEKKAHDKYFDNISTMMSLSVAYAANCGGIATLTGTPPNLVLMGQMDGLFGDGNHPIAFGTWMAFGFPVSVVSLFVAWMWLLLCFLRGAMFKKCCNRKDGMAVKEIFFEEYKKLGPWSCAEISVLVLFILLILLWFFKAPGFIPGWASFFLPKHIADATPAMSITILLFMLPSEFPRCGNKYQKAPVPRLLNWHVVTHNLPWNVLILLGGGFAMAEIAKTSGLSAWVGDRLEVFGVLPTWLMVLLLSTVIAALTEVTSNTATAALMLTIVAALAKKLCLNPLLLMLPTTVAASFAFMLPVATPPNAIVFAYGHVRIRQMILVGIPMNIFCILIVTLAVNTWGMAYFQLDKYPLWANSTDAINCTIYNGTTTI